MSGERPVVADNKERKQEFEVLVISLSSVRVTVETCFLLLKENLGSVDWLNCFHVYCKATLAAGT